MPISLPRDANRIAVIGGVSSSDGVTVVAPYVDPVTHRLLVNSSGGGGTPGGSDTQLQYNNAGAFGGITGATTNGTTVTLTSPIIANIVPGANFTLTQNSVAAFTSEETGAIVNTLYLKAGNVGIGTTSPASKLQVAGGNLQLDSGQSIFWGSSGNDQIQMSAGTNIRMILGGTERVRVDNNGNVGIGTTSPGYKLDVNGTINSGGGSLAYRIGGSLFAGASSNFTNVYAQSSGLYIWEYTGNNVRMAILDNGNVGIGTTSPNALLNVNGAVRVVNNQVIGLESTVSGTNAGRIYADASNKFYVETLSSANPLVLQSTGGSVGIGTTSPVGTLNVSAGGNKGIRIDTTSTNNSIEFGNAAGTANGYTWSMYRSGNDLRFYDLAGGGADRLTLQSGGNVGIGVASPTAALHLKAGTATASTAPLKFTSGTLLTTAEAGAVEFLTDAFYGTITTGAARKQFLFTDGSAALLTSFPTLNQDTTGTAAKATILATTRAIYGNNFDGSAALTQIIASTYGGTGNGFTKFSGATTAEKTYTLPDASTTILTTNAAVTVAQGGTGVGSFTAHNVLTGGSAGTALGSVAPGTSGNVLTSDGTDWTSAAPAGGSTPTISFGTIFESNSSRFILDQTGTGTEVFDSNGVSMKTGATISSYAQLIANILLGTSKLEVGNPSFSGSFYLQTSGTTFDYFIGIGSPGIDGSGITFTDKHIGFKVVRTASGTINLFATQANGTTETASSSLTTLTDGDDLELILKVNSTTSVDYYWRKNSGTLSAATNLTTNMPTTVGGSITIKISNHGVATATTLVSTRMNYTR